MGKFIVLDGIDGVGTTTHAKALGTWLKKHGYSVTLTQEPTTLSIGSLIQSLIKSDETSAFVDALLFAADRLAHLDKIILPAISAGNIVISDRYVESSIAYQTAAGAELSWILELNRFARVPDAIIILDVDPEIGLQRKKVLSDKFEKVDFLRKVREIYLERAKLKGYPVIRTDGPKEKVQQEIRKLIKDFL